jgi:hypothetical protein
VNAVPVIDAITVQGSRARQPAGFADLGETVNVAAQVRDQETPVDQLQYIWTAPVGTFTGTGARVTWQAPAAGSTPGTVTLTLQVVERFGTNSEHRVSSISTVALHDSAREVGEMARQFLVDFSNTDLKDASVVMRNFGSAATCPVESDISDERRDVINHFTNFRMESFQVGQPTVTINFGGLCPFRGRQGDACARVPVFWDSTNLSSGLRGAVRGEDIIAAAYSPTDRRWWLCASDFDGQSVSGTRMLFYLRR